MMMEAEIGVMTSQGMSRIADSHQKLGERPGTDSPSQTSEETNPTDTMMCSLQNYETINFCCFKPSSLCYFANGISRKVIQGRKQILEDH